MSTDTPRAWLRTCAIIGGYRRMHEPSLFDSRPIDATQRPAP